MCVYMGAPIDLTGKRFGRLVVVSEASPHYSKGGSKQRQWNCLCDCGKEIITTTQNLRKGDTKSCGCLKIEMNINNATTHGDSKSKLYSVWKAMRKRCKNTHNSDYKYYGCKGIKVCNMPESPIRNIFCECESIRHIVKMNTCRYHFRIAVDYFI